MQERLKRVRVNGGIMLYNKYRMDICPVFGKEEMLVDTPHIRNELERRGIYGAIDDETRDTLNALPSRLLQRASMITLKRNYILIRKGEKTKYAYLVLSGNLMVLNEFEDGNYFSFANLGAGKFISDLEVLSGNMVNAVTLLSTEPTKCLKCPIEDFIWCLDNDLAFLKRVVGGFARSMFHTSSERGENVYRKGANRLIVYIANYCPAVEISAPVIIKKTRRDIASSIGVCEKTINRAVKDLIQLGYIKIYKGKITINPDQLERMLEYYRREIKR